MILTITLREIRTLLALPSTWFILGILNFIFAWLFLARLDAFLQVQAQLAQLLNAPGATQSVAAPMFGTLALFMMMLTPIFSMRMIAEEKRNQTLALLMAAPVSNRQIVLGKYFGLLLFLVLIIMVCVFMILTLALGTPLDYGLLTANLIGLMLLAASYTALGLYFSTLTAQPIVAATSTLALLSGLWLIDMTGSSANPILKAFSPSAHFHNFNNGLLLGNDLAYFALFITAFILLAIRRMNNARIYGT